MSLRVRGLGLVLVMTVLLGLMASPAAANQFGGGKGLTSIQFPNVLDPGSLQITLHTRAFVKSLPGKNYSLADGTGAISFNFGFTRRVELGFTQILYQDLNQSALSNGFKAMEQIPDDSYLRVKVGAYPFSLGNAYFKFGFLNQLRYRTGLVNNVYLEPYSGDGIEWETDALLSCYLNPLYEDNAPAFHLNAGYLNYNDAGVGNSAFKAAQSFTYGLGFVYPTRRFDFFLETAGNLFLRYPQAFAYSRENYQYATPGLRWKMLYGLSATLALDVLVWQGKDQTDYTHPDILPIPAGEPNYAPWRLNGGISISPSTSFYKQPTFSQVADPQNARKMMRDRKSLFEWVVDEQQGTQYIDVELEKIKAERKKAEAELEKLKKDLEKK